MQNKRSVVFRKSIASLFCTRSEGYSLIEEPLLWAQKLYGLRISQKAQLARRVKRRQNKNGAREASGRLGLSWHEHVQKFGEMLGDEPRVVWSDLVFVLVRVVMHLINWWVFLISRDEVRITDAVIVSSNADES